MATRDIGRVAKSDILTMHSTPSFATQWLMSRLARFSAVNPDIDVRLNASSEVCESDGSGRYRHPLGARKMQPAGTMVLELPPETIVPLCSPALMTGDYPLRSVADLQHHALIHSEGCLVSWRDWMRLHRKTRLDIGRGPRFDRSFMALSAAVDGLGVCLESMLLAQRELDTGTARRTVRPGRTAGAWLYAQPAEVARRIAEAA